MCGGWLWTDGTDGAGQAVRSARRMHREPSPWLVRDERPSRAVGADLEAALERPASFPSLDRSLVASRPNGLQRVGVTCPGPVGFHGQRGTLSASDVLLVGLLLVLWPLTAAAQPSSEPQSVPPEGPVSLAAWVGFQFTSSIATNGGTISIDPAPSYGASLTLAIDPEFQLELLGSFSSTEAHLVSSGSVASTGQDHVNISYIQAGFTKSIRCGDFECFGDLTIGAVLLAPGDILLSDGERLNVHDTWRAAFTLGAGIRFHLGGGLALVLQGRLLVPVYITSASFYAGNGSSVLVVSAGIPCVEGVVSAGFVLVL